MINPYKMVVVNIIASFVLLLIFLFYKYIYPKKTPPYVLIVFMLSLLPLISLLRRGTYESGDLSLHAQRIFSFSKIIFDEHIRPIWTPEFNAGYGDPHFSFSYFFPYFLASILHKAGLSIILSLKMILAVSYICSGLFMYFWIKNEIDEKAGLVAAIFYLFTPYHLVDMHFRVTVAECMTFALIPLCLYLTSKIIKRFSYKYVFLLSFSLALLILTHQVISLGFIPILISYSLLIWYIKSDRKIKDLLFILLSIILGLGLSAFYWIPVLAESKFTQASLSNSVSVFTSIKELLYSPWRYGLLFQGHGGELSFLVGYTQILVLILAVITLFRTKNKKIKILTLYFLALSFIFIFLILPYSNFFWQNVPLLKYFQYSYRILTFLTLSISVLAGIVITQFKNKLFLVFLILITVLYTILNWGNRRTIPEINDAVLIQEYLVHPDVSSGYLEPSSPIWTNIKYKFLRKNDGKHIEILRGNTQVKEISRTSTKHVYIFNVASSDVVIKENTLYFPGWKVIINGKTQDAAHDSTGVIKFKLNKGLQKVDLKFEETKDRKIGKHISILSVLFIILIFLLQLKKKKKINN